MRLAWTTRGPNNFHVGKQVRSTGGPNRIHLRVGSAYRSTARPRRAAVYSVSLWRHLRVLACATIDSRGQPSRHRSCRSVIAWDNRTQAGVVGSPTRTRPCPVIGIDIGIRRATCESAWTRYFAM